MELSLAQFEVFTSIEKEQNIKLSQRKISDLSKISLGSVNKITADLLTNDLIKKDRGCYLITDKGYDVLEPYRVKRAIFIAAGFGSRLMPLTINSPKPLIRVNGVRMIDTLLDAVYAVGINEVIIVRGYLKEQFDQLLYKYPNIKFIENPFFTESNNISSAFCVKDLLQNAYVLEADLVLSNPNLITKYQYQSNYLGVKTEMTNDWCFETDKNKRITKLQVGGENVYHMFGISYWNQLDGEKLEKDIQTVYNSPGGKEKYWDQVALESCKRNYKIFVRECTFDDIVEIDTYNDIKKIDKHYCV